MSHRWHLNVPREKEKNCAQTIHALIQSSRTPVSSVDPFGEIPYKIIMGLAREGIGGPLVMLSNPFTRTSAAKQKLRGRLSVSETPVGRAIHLGSGRDIAER